ncbi:PREDICTED: uncharacterized protein LOC109114158 [Nelumbo nucifera]|uniref:Uncharacterized protein LOC109114158 n=1 Tax=Nelumbo nucifera TaxID=4432 RepID=A0A1U8Q1Q5_NELNU|nr:PREDICTED: uncharacterized protein LOC109114158 [Nelumbo nucifera]
MEITRSSDGIILSQCHYFLDLLKRANMVSTKPLTSPMVTASKLSKHSGDLLVDPSEYGCLVGALQNVTLTRPNISFSVNKVCQFLHVPTIVHCAIVKRVLRYLKFTLDRGLHFYSTSPLSLHAFFDANRIGCLDDRRSTDAYAMFLGHNLIAWSSKKQAMIA